MFMISGEQGFRYKHQIVNTQKTGMKIECTERWDIIIMSMMDI